MAHRVFLPVVKDKVYGQEIKILMNKGKVYGDIGLEVECEGNKFYKSGGLLEPFWEYHEDHSLRGEDNAEYVLQSPIPFEEVPVAIRSLWDMFQKYGTVLDESNRTSVHLHLNVGNWNVNRLASFTAMFFALEEILAEWAGDHRVGNLFCLRAKDAPNIVHNVKKFIQLDGQLPLHEGLHYAGLNIQALHKFGSVENRYLRGATDPQLILDWVAINRRLYEFSAEFPDPREVCNSFSYGGPMFFFNAVLGDTVDIVRAGIDWNDEQIADSLYEGIRMAQDICFCRDWSVFVPVTHKDDPFGRPKKKTMSFSQLASDIAAEPMFSPTPPQPAGTLQSYFNGFILNGQPAQPVQATPLDPFTESSNPSYEEDFSYDPEE